MKPDDQQTGHATVRLDGGAIPASRGPARSIEVAAVFASKNQLLIGRSGDCDICLPHPTISRRHALLERVPGGLRLRDLDSVNGVLVGGRQIAEPVILKEQERVGIGPFLFCLAGNVIHTLDSSQSLRLEARNLEKVIALKGGGVHKLLDDINLAVEPGEFISLLGPSGSGKSTLMDCLNGRRPATGGRVLANGEDFYRHFDSFRQSLGYVPQRDIVHTQLTVYRALYYTAQLRLPTDTSDAELRTRIQEVLDKMDLQPHRDTLVANLSGGQIKRVSLGAELLARPCLLYIDEATSGLDAGTEARMMRLFRHMANEGKSVICITHNVDNVDECNLILVLVKGKLVYYGPPAEARPYFGVSRLSEVYDRLGEKEPATWNLEFSKCSLYREFVAKRLASAPPESAILVAPPPREESRPPEADGNSSIVVFPATAGEVAASKAGRPPLWHQFRVLATRYSELIWGDARTLRLLMLQAPIVALFLLLGFINRPYQKTMLAPRHLKENERQLLEKIEPTVKQAEKGILEQIRPQFDNDAGGPVDQLVHDILASDFPVVPNKLIVDPRFTYMLLFMLVIIVLWFGCNNAAKEIVKEEAIYSRERAVNLGILPYLASKFLVLCFISAIQVFLLMLVVYGALELAHTVLGWEVPPALYRLDYPTQYALLLLLSMTGIALGLLLSACVSSPDRANTLLPYVLIPQIILGGGILPVKEGALYLIAFVGSPAYWAFRGVRRGASTLPVDLPQHMDHNDNVWLAAAGLAVQMTVLLLLTAWFLKQKDVRKA
jgi:ABC-type multidrug transport system ATPase subunit